MADTVDVLRLLAKLGIEVQSATGGELWGLCPAHADRRPSWSINQKTGVHHCFSCGWGGGPGDLVARTLGDRLAWDSRDGWQWIKDQGLLIDDSAMSLDVELYLVDSSRKVFGLPSGVMIEGLSSWPTPAARYIQKRQITGWQLRRWNVGYAIGGRLAGRIVFPVYDSKSRLLSYSARSFVGDECRYLTPHESEGADDAAIFGERYWPTIERRKRLVVVEGAIKCLAVERAVGGYQAGLLGATQARNPKVISKLSTFEEVLVLTDNDKAGNEAAEYLVASLLRHVKMIRRVKMPNKPVDDAPVEEVTRQLV